MKKSLFVLMVAALMVGCSSAPERHAQANYEPSYPMNLPAMEQPQNGSLFQANASSLFNDIKAHRVGDIITVMLEEKTDAKKKASTKTSKSSSVAALNPTIGGSPLSIGGVGIDASIGSKSSFAGAGDAAQSNSFTGQVSVTVHEVLSNGYLVVRGEKWVTINQGEEIIRFSGIIRPQDIKPDNTIASQKVADARIFYSGAGMVNDAQKQGFLTEFFTKFWPI